MRKLSSSVRPCSFASALVIAFAVSFSGEALAFGRAPAPSTGPEMDECTRVPTPSSDGLLDFFLAQAGGFTTTQKSKLAQAIEIVRKVMNSELFRERVANYTWNGQNRFASTDKTPDQVYAAIMAARETYTQDADGVAQLCLNIYTPPFYKKWSVVGYTYPNKPKIYMNSYYFNSFTPKEIAGNISHEWTHKIGFDHDFDRTAQRPYSVPYAVGDMVSELADQVN